MKKYLLCPGMVTSRTDGDQHYIGVAKLAGLYGVSLFECEVLTYDPLEPRSLAEARKQQHAGLIRLAPRDDGDYRLPTV
jgi:hypothetical protein